MERSREQRRGSWEAHGEGTFAIAAGAAGRNGDRVGSGALSGSGLTPTQAQGVL